MARTSHASRSTEKADALARARDKQVSEAIDELEAEGEDATVTAIVKRTRGSYRDLCPVIAAVKARREAERAQRIAVPDLPPELGDLASTIWGTAWRLADMTAAEARQAHAARLAAAQIDIAEREEALGLVEAERDEAQGRAEVAEAERDHLAAKLQIVERELDRAQAQLEGQDRTLRLFVATQAALTPDPVPDVDALQAARWAGIIAGQAGAQVLSLPVRGTIGQEPPSATTA